MLQSFALIVLASAAVVQAQTAATVTMLRSVRGQWNQMSYSGQGEPTDICNIALTRRAGTIPWAYPMDASIPASTRHIWFAESLQSGAIHFNLVEVTMRRQGDISQNWPVLDGFICPMGAGLINSWVARDRQNWETFMMMPTSVIADSLNVTRAAVAAQAKTQPLHQANPPNMVSPYCPAVECLASLPTAKHEADARIPGPGSQVAEINVWDNGLANITVTDETLGLKTEVIACTNGQIRQTVSSVATGRYSQQIVNTRGLRRLATTCSYEGTIFAQPPPKPEQLPVAVPVEVPVALPVPQPVIVEKEVEVKVPAIPFLPPLSRFEGRVSRPRAAGRND